MSSAARKPSYERTTDSAFPRGAGDLDTARRLVASLRQGRDLREGKVARLRSAIDSNAYENELKLSVAVDRLLEKLELVADAE
jgi:hypothetical protein